MLFQLDGTQVTELPHQEDYKRWRSNLSDEDYDNAVNAIKKYVAEKYNAPEPVFNASYIPGKDWNNTPYQPLHVACGMSRTQSAMFFGLLVWKVMMEPDVGEWMFIPGIDKNGNEIGMTYWRKES